MWATRLPMWRRSVTSLPHRTHQVRCFASTSSSTPPSSSSSTSTSSSSSTSPPSTSNSSSDSSSTSSFNTLNYIREQNLPLKAKDVAIMRNLTEDERKAYLYYLFVSNKKRANKVMSKPLKLGEEDAINSLENLKPVDMRDPVGEIKDPEEDMEEPDEDADPVKELKKMNPAQIEAQQMEFVANYEINAHLYKLKKNRLLLMDQKEDKSLTPAPTSPPPEFKNIDYDSFASFLQEVDNSFFETNFPFRSDIAPKKKNTDDTMEQRRAITRKRLWDEARILREKHKLFQMLPVRFVVTQGRHVKVTRAGKRQTFSYLVLAGNGRGYGGYGHGKGPSLDVALNKAMLDVRRHLMFVPLHESRTIFNDMVAKCRQTKVLMMSTPRYSGIKGSRLIRAVCEVFGITDITTKVLGRRHVKNTLFAFLNGLSQQTSIRERAIIWGKNVYKMYEPGVYTPRMITEAEILEQSAVVATILNDLSEEHRGDPLRDPMVAIQHNTHLITTLQDRKFGGIGKDGENKLDARTQETKEGEEGEKKDEPSGDGTKKKKRSPSAGRGRGLLKVRKIKRNPFEYPEHPPTPLDR